MRTTIVLVSSLLAMTLVGWFFRPVEAQEKEKAPPLPKWEYKLVDTNTTDKKKEIEDSFSTAGSDGWELVINYRDHPDSRITHFVFKRAKR